MGKHHILQYQTLEGVHDMKICEQCTTDIQRSGIDEEAFRKEIKKTDREIDRGRNSED
jgi:hypothetical protein